MASSSSSVVQCFFGINLSEQCRGETNDERFESIGSFDLKTRTILSLRADIPLDDDSITICKYHKLRLVDRYPYYQRSCCDPFRCHKKPVKGNLRELLPEYCQKNAKKCKLVPGKKICGTCMHRVKVRQEDESNSDETEIENEAAEDAFDPDDTDLLNVSNSSLGISPIKLHSIPSYHRSTYGKRKFTQASSLLQDKIAKTLGVEASTLQDQDAGECSNCTDLNKMVDNMKEKVAKSSRQEKVQVLTMVPPSWTVEKTIQEFKVTAYLVKKARKLKEEEGVFAVPQPKKGKQLSPEVVEQVKNFYESDEVSRMCPGKKDFVTVRINGQLVQKQKRLLLANIDELYTLFKDKTGCKIGRTKFFQLRPKWCVTVRSSGSHNVCVCVQHQNVKLMVTKVPDDATDYKTLLEKVVCDITSSQCMLNRCDNCPGKDSLKTFLQNTFSKDFDEEDIISYKQWVHTDRTELITVQETVEEFISKLTEKVHKLAPHHFVAKTQASYLRECKENLNDTTAIILLDFAENYSFVVQDAIQGFYWENQQATIHPIVVYHKQHGKLECMNLCIISDHMKHDTVTVHACLKVALEHLKTSLPEIKNVIYFSDGAASQYKNYKNFTNLCYHLEDFGLTAQWNFFATSHGKSACDGIGGTVKRLTSRASLQRPVNDQILNPMDMYQFCTKNIQGIAFFYVSSASIAENDRSLEIRFQNGKTVQGTREHHQFTPVDFQRLKVRRVSKDDHSFIAKVHSGNQIGEEPTENLECHSGQFVACVYGSEWWIGVVRESSSEYDDMRIQFMHTKGTKQAYFWPNAEDLCWVPISHILCKVQPPSTCSSSGRLYTIDEQSVLNIEKKYQDFKSNNGQIL